MKNFRCTTLFVLASLALFSSCVSNRKVTMLQKEDVNKRGEDLVRDTVIRTYAVDTFEYRVQPNDILYVEFRSLTDKQFDFLQRDNSGPGQMVVQIPAVLGELVDEQGYIPVPVLGKVKVSGMTVFEIQDLLQGMSNRYVESPVVKVRLLNYRVTVLGEVNREGTITLSNNRVTLLEAIGLAGGLGELADRTKVKLIRQRGGVTEVQYIDLRDERFLQSEYYYVHQNDVLVVPPLKQRPFRRYFGQNLSLLVSTISVALVTITLIKN